MILKFKILFKKKILFNFYFFPNFLYKKRHHATIQFFFLYFKLNFSREYQNCPYNIGPASTLPLQRNTFSEQWVTPKLLGNTQPHLRPFPPNPVSNPLLLSIVDFHPRNWVFKLLESQSPSEFFPQVDRSKVNSFIPFSLILTALHLPVLIWEIDLAIRRISSFFLRSGNVQLCVL